MATLETKIDNSSNKSLFTDEKPKAKNRSNSDLDRKGQLMVRAIEREQ